MKYNELFNNTTGIGVFENIFYTDYPDLYNALFGDTLPKTLDIFAYKFYGYRTLLSGITADDYKNSVVAVIELFGDKWRKQTNALATEYSILNAPVKTTTHNETTTTTGTDADTTTESNKVYNDTDYNETHKTERNGNNSADGTRVYTTTETGYSGNAADAIRKEYDLRSINLKRNIVADLVRTLTIDIF